MEKRATFSSLWLAAAFIAPQILLVFVFFYWPSGEALYWAAHARAALRRRQRVGRLAQFRYRVLRPKYWGSVRVSLFFAAAATAISLAIAAVLALFVDRRLAGHQVYKFSYFLPYALAAPAVGLAFRFIFSPDAGFVSAINRVFPDLWNPALDG